MAIEHITPEWIAGDTEVLEFIIGDDRGIPLDLTDYTGRMQIRGSVNGLVLAEVEAIVDTSLSSMQFVFTPELTAALRVGGTVVNFVYDAESVSPSGVVTTEVYGTIPVRTDITR